MFIYQLAPQTWDVCDKYGNLLGEINQSAPRRFQWKLPQVRRYRDRTRHNIGHESSLSKAMTAILINTRGHKGK